MTNRTARALNSSSYFFGMMRTTFPRKKVCIKHGVVHSPVFVGLVVGAILIVVGLEFFPALALGPLVEGVS